MPAQKAPVVNYASINQTAYSMARETPKGEPNVPKTKMKNIMARDISSGYWVVRNERDLENYLNQVRERVTAELDGETVIRIQF